MVYLEVIFSVMEGLDAVVGEVIFSLLLNI